MSLVRRTFQSNYVWITKVGPDSARWDMVIQYPNCEPEIKPVFHRLPRTSEFPLQELSEGYVYFLNQVTLDNEWYLLQGTEMPSAKVVRDEKLMKTLAETLKPSAASVQS